MATCKFLSLPPNSSAGVFEIFVLIFCPGLVPDARVCATGGADVAFPGTEVFGVPCAGSVTFMINFPRFPQTAPTVGAGFLSRRNTSTGS
ncbi:unnamed protein product [Prunus brigantina]